MVSADYIQQGLVQRGLPAHIAQGFVMNMRDESGLNPGINERAPLVQGSRGGYGLYQLTGPRRRAYESYASSRGVAFDNADAQLDFLMSELQGPEKRAAQSIFSTDNPQDAAVAIARDFLRPAASNLQKRVASYTGNKDPQATASTQGTAPMMQQEEETPRGLLGGLGIQKMQEGAPGETGQRFYERDSFKDTAAVLAQGFGRMGIMGMEEIADGIAKQRTETKAKNKTMEALSKMNTPQAQAAVEYINAGGDAVSALKMAFTPAKDDSTALMKNYEFFVSQGMDPEDAMKAVRSGTTINMGDVGQGDYLYGSKAGLQPGYRLNVKTGEASPIPGGPADTAAKEAEAADAGTSTQATAGSTVLGDITEMKRRVQESPTLTTGFIGGILKKVGGTGALDVDELGKTIRANIGFDRLQRMRDESPTGGALGQVAVQELEALQASLGSLNTSQGPDQLIRNLERLETQYRKSMQRILNTEGGAKYFTQGEADLIQNAQQGSSQTKTGITYKVLD
jgi:hypothetical protein